MVYAVIFEKWADQIKIGYTGRTLSYRYGGLRQMLRRKTWDGDKNHETALRCLMGLVPARGLDWFELSSDRYNIIQGLEQEYLDALASRVATLRMCDRCERRYHMQNLFDNECPGCGARCWRSPLIGQSPDTGREALRRELHLERYCYPPRPAPPPPAWKPPITVGDDDEYAKVSRVCAFRTSDMVAFLRQRNAGGA